jgi:hypothetical protein
MKLDRSLPWPRWSVLALAILLITVGACAGSADREVAVDAAETTMEVGEAETLETRPASRAYVDPQTGRLVPAPVAGEDDVAEALLPERLSRFQDDLVAEPLPEGGFGVDLRGRFRTDTVAHLDADGRLRIGCVDSQEAAEEVSDRPSTEVEGGDDDS